MIAAVIHPEVEKHIPAIRQLCREFGIARLEIFGSAITDDFDPQRSDVDFIVTLPEGFDYGPWGSRYFLIEERLSNILQREVDMVSASSLERKANRYFLQNVTQTRRPVFDARNVSDAA